MFTVQFKQHHCLIKTWHWWLNSTDCAERTDECYKQALKVSWLDIKRHVIDRLLRSASLQRGSWRKHQELQTWRRLFVCFVSSVWTRCVVSVWCTSWWRVWRCFYTWTYLTRGCWSCWGSFVEVWNLYVVLLQSITQRDENSGGSGGTSPPSADRRAKNKEERFSVPVDSADSSQTSRVFWLENHWEQQRSHHTSFTWTCTSI